jgi:hypothetical protein
VDFKNLPLLTKRKIEIINVHLWIKIRSKKKQPKKKATLEKKNNRKKTLHLTTSKFVRIFHFKTPKNIVRTLLSLHPDFCSEFSYNL